MSRRSSSSKEGSMKGENRKQHEQGVNGVVPGDDDLLVQRRIALRAYELYLQRGGVDGHAGEDWLQAEREILEERH
jgi:hypothetical protein